jgi:catechol 2,3-dioxygenase-like lactoylglutathione lyase family enzyme
VPAKLGDQGEPVDLMFSGVVKNVDLDEAEEELPDHFIAPRRCWVRLGLDHARTIQGVDIGSRYFDRATGSPEDLEEDSLVPTVNVRYMVNDVDAAVTFYTSHLGFTILSKTLPAFADVARGDLRLLLSGPTSSAGRAMPDGRQPAPGGWNRIHLIVEDLTAEVRRLRAAGVHFRNDIVTGPGGSQILLEDPSGNPIELFQPRREC